MSTLKRRLHRKNSSGGYDTIHLETESSLVLRPSGRTVEEDLAAYLPEVQSSDTVPESLKSGKLVTGSSKAWIGTFGEIGHPYTHPSAKQCSYAYTHPVAKQCNYSYSHPSTKQCDAAAGNHSHDLSALSGVLPVIKGGTGVTTIDALKSVLGIGGGSGTPSSLTKPSVGSVGSTLTWAGYTWRVVHDDGKLVYLITEAILELIQFSSIDGNNGYLGSKIHQRCLKFAADADITNCNFVADIMGGKVFIAGYDQINGGFSYFSSDSNRIAYYSGTAANWWTNSPDGSNYGCVLYVYSNGIFNGRDGYPSAPFGFRPCVALIK